jgi:hypothetical protein
MIDRFHHDKGELASEAEIDRMALREAFSYCGCGAEEDDHDEALKQYVRQRQELMGYC